MHPNTHQSDYGTSQKHFGVYVFGFITCIILTLVAFYGVMHPSLSRHQLFTLVFGTALVQFIVQAICFLGLNVKTLQGKMNVTSLIYTMIVAGTTIFGSIWIMYNLNYFMMN